MDAPAEQVRLRGWLLARQNSTPNPSAVKAQRVRQQNRRPSSVVERAFDVTEAQVSKRLMVPCFVEPALPALHTHVEAWA